MMRGYHYPAGREKLHSLGALDLALWDLKAKALDVPVSQLLGGKSRDHIELYSTAFPRPWAARSKMPRALASMPASASTGMRPTTRASAKSTASRSCGRCTGQRTHAQGCRWRPVGHGFPTELDPPVAINLATLIEPLHPYFCEDLIRTENVETFATIRERRACRSPPASSSATNGTSTRSSSANSSITRESRYRSRRYHGVHEDHRARGDALHRNDPAFHGPYLRGCARPLPNGYLGRCTHGDAR